MSAASGNLFEVLEDMVEQGKMPWRLGQWEQAPGQNLKLAI